MNGFASRREFQWNISQNGFQKTNNRTRSRINGWPRMSLPDSVAIAAFPLDSARPLLRRCSWPIMKSRRDARSACWDSTGDGFLREDFDIPANEERRINKKKMKRKNARQTLSQCEQSAAVAQTHSLTIFGRRANKPQLIVHLIDVNA